METKDEERHFLKKVHDTFGADRSYQDSKFYIGAEIFDDKTYWHNDGNKPILYDFEWAPSHPNKNVGRCVEIGLSNVGYQMNNVDCAKESYFVCQKVINDPNCDKQQSSFKEFTRYQKTRCNKFKTFHHSELHKVIFFP